MIEPFFSFYGGKWRDAVKHYPSPIYDTIIELFAGSAGYSVRYADRKIVLCEIDLVIYCLWRYLIRVSPQEILSIPDVDLESGLVDDLKVCYEAKYLVGFWLNKGSVIPHKSASRWMRDGTRPDSFWGESIRQRIALQVEKIRHWQIYNCEYYDCPVSRQRATWFIDPPYQFTGDKYRFSSSRIDYVQLSKWCRTRDGQIIVCEQDGAIWLPFSHLADVRSQRTGEAKNSSEMIWTKHQLYRKAV